MGKEFVLLSHIFYNYVFIKKDMAQLFGIDKSGISCHISNIFKEKELMQDTTVAKIATVVD